jgi:hypothetical protein
MAFIHDRGREQPGREELRIQVRLRLADAKCLRGLVPSRSTQGGSSPPCVASPRTTVANLRPGTRWGRKRPHRDSSDSRPSGAWSSNYLLRYPYDCTMLMSPADVWQTVSLTSPTACTARMAAATVMSQAVTRTFAAIAAFTSLSIATSPRLTLTSPD